MDEIKPRYLGDGVYASHDGYQVWLKTQNGSAIALEPSVIVSLLDYFKYIAETIAAAKATAKLKDQPG